MSVESLQVIVRAETLLVSMQGSDVAVDEGGEVLRVEIGTTGPTGPAGPAGADGAQGPQGPAGADATVHARRYEESGNYIYAATAPSGSAEDAAVWRITRITYSSGTQTALGVATDVTWTGRAGHTYT